MHLKLCHSLNTHLYSRACLRLCGAKSSNCLQDPPHFCPTTGADCSSVTQLKSMVQQSLPWVKGGLMGPPRVHCPRATLDPVCQCLKCLGKYCQSRIAGKPNSLLSMLSEGMQEWSSSFETPGWNDFHNIFHCDKVCLFCSLHGIL